MSKTFNLRNQLLCVALLITFVVGIPIQSYTQVIIVVPAAEVDTRITQDTGYWAALMWYPNEGDITPYAVSNIFRARGCADNSGEVLKYVKSKIEIAYPKTFYLICYPTYEETASKLKAPARYQVRTNWTIPDMDGSGSSKSGSAVDSTDDEDNESDGEADSDPPSSNTTANAQKNSKIAPNGSVDSSAWAEEDGKKYTQGQKGHWEEASFKATAWCADKMSMKTGYVDACVVDEHGKGAFKGTFVEIRNSSPNYPVYYGLSGVLNKKAGPQEIVTEDLHMYVPIDPAKRAQMPDTVVEILVKYWVEGK